MLIFFNLSISFAQNNSSPCNVSSYFSPYDNIEKVIHAHLITATTSVHCSLNGIMNLRLADDLMALKNKDLIWRQLCDEICINFRTEKKCYEIGLQKRC